MRSRDAASSWCRCSRDYITQSTVQALGGIVTNDPAESFYLNAFSDSASNPLGAGRYSITFRRLPACPR